MKTIQVTAHTCTSQHIATLLHMSQRLRKPTLRRHQLKTMTSPSDVILSNRLHWNFEDISISRLLICHCSKQNVTTEFRIFEYTKNDVTWYRHIVLLVTS
jgi:hypothetical protein